MKIKIKDIELDLPDGCNVEIDGDKVSVSGIEPVVRYLQASPVYWQYGSLGNHLNICYQSGLQAQPANQYTQLGYQQNLIPSR